MVMLTDFTEQYSDKRTVVYLFPLNVVWMYKSFLTKLLLFTVSVQSGIRLVNYHSLFNFRSYTTTNYYIVQHSESVLFCCCFNMNSSNFVSEESVLNGVKMNRQTKEGRASMVHLHFSKKLGICSIAAK